MVSEVYFLPLLPRPILNIQYADQVSSPASQQTIEKLEEDARGHAQLGERVWQGEKNLCHLQTKTINQQTTY